MQKLKVIICVWYNGATVSSKLSEETEHIHHIKEAHCHGIVVRNLVVQIFQN